MVELEIWDWELVEVELLDRELGELEQWEWAIWKYVHLQLQLVDVSQTKQIPIQ